MMSRKMYEALNAQINMEMWSAMLYLAMSIDTPLDGASHWLRKQSEEELSHAMRIVDYMRERGEKAELQPIAQVRTSWDNLQEIFSAALEHEKRVSASIHALYTLATEERDYATQLMLQWFTNEQVEEEATIRTLLDKIECFGKNSASLYLLDSELMTR